MKTIEKAITEINNNITNKAILEVACGCAEFSIEASKHAKTVHCIDLDNIRLSTEISSVSNIDFEIMDATSMNFQNNTFDTIVIYNAIAHIESVFMQIINECIRVLKENGQLYIISSWKLDKAIINDKVIDILNENKIKFDIHSKNNIMYLNIL